MDAREVKINSLVQTKELIEFSKDHNPKHSIIVILEISKFLITASGVQIFVYPIKDFREEL